MKRRTIFLLLVAFGVVLVPYRSPAPLVYRPGEGWVYEPVGSEGKWIRIRAKDQLEVATTAFTNRDYSLALKAARRVVNVWPTSDYAPQAQYLVGRCYEAKHYDEKAFKEYQKIIEKYPKYDDIDEVLRRQYAITGRFLAGQWFKLWGVIPFFPSMDRTASMYEIIVKNGPYSEVAPHAQLRMGAAREKQKNYPEAVKAYETAADRYDDRPLVAADALYRAGISYQKQASTAEYDQSMAGKAIDTLIDFITRYPNDARVPRAQQIIASLRTEQARGNFQIAMFYEKKKKWNGALVYYNQVTQADPNSVYASQALQRMDAIKKRMPATAP